MAAIVLTIVLLWTQVGQFVHRVIAMDPDEKPVLRYHIDAENSEARSEEGTIIKSSEYDYMSLFDLNSLDGQLRVVKLLDRERVETIRLGIRVEDLAASKEKQISSGRTKYHWSRGMDLKDISFWKFLRSVIEFQDTT